MDATKVEVNGHGLRDLALEKKREKSDIINYKLIMIRIIIN